MATDVPYLVRAVYPIGKERLEFVLDSTGAIGPMTRVRDLQPSIRKRSGQMIPTNIFTLSEFDFSDLTGILHSHASVENHGWMRLIVNEERGATKAE